MRYHRMRLAFFLFVLATPSGAEAPAGKVYRLAHLAPTAESLAFTRSATLPELAILGFVEGRNLIFDSRVGKASELPALARDLVLTEPDAIIAIGPEAIRAAQAATKRIPIVVFGDDPVSLYSAESIVRPGGNVTGVNILASELDAKRLELLHEMVPSVRRVAALLMPTSAGRALSERKMRSAADRLGLELLLFDAAQQSDYPAKFAAMRANGAQALVIMGDPIFLRDAARLAQLALESHLPTACEWAEMAQSGCTFGYGSNRAELRRRLAHLVALIFRGSAPGELPIELPTRFEFAINLKVANALGITVPTPFLTRADEVIE